MNINENAESSASQRKNIREWLMAGHSVTPLTALRKWGCFRLGARIWELRHEEGLEIINQPMVTATGKRVANYKLKLAN